MEDDEELPVEAEALDEDGARENESDAGSALALATTSSRQIIMRFCLVEERGV